MRVSLARPILFITLVVMQVPQLKAQVALDYYLPAGTSYDQTVPTPESFFGFQVGEWHLQPDQVTNYMEALARTSSRVSIETYGRSHEQRPLVLLTITSPENQKRIDPIRNEHLGLTDPAVSAKANVEKMPIVVWLGYSVHGNEPSGSNASTLVAYHLAAAQGETMNAMLKDMVVLLVPSINPDGLNRFAHWANMHKGNVLVANSESREHNEAWPSGRTNHYWFDLNRDWMPVQHPESRARLHKFHEWMPTILTDHHEMGTNQTFFFQPGIPSRNNPQTPAKNQELTAAIARYHAKALDAIGSLYFTKETFDDFYIGKGSSYPDVVGSIGILFEQASSRGHLQESINGDLHFSFAIRNQVVTSFSTLEAAAAMRKELLSYQRDFFSVASKDANDSKVKGYIFASPSDPVRSYYLIDLLRHHQIDVYELARNIQAGNQKFTARQAFVVPTNQRHFTLLTALFERRTTFQDSLFYDISAWTLPLAFNMNYAEMSTLSPNDLGSRIDDPVFPQGSFGENDNAVAYAMRWDSYFSPKALYKLLKEKISVRVAQKPFTAQTGRGNTRFDNGTIVVSVHQQKSETAGLLSLLRSTSQECGVDWTAIESGLSVDGIDLGSGNFEVLQIPKVALIVGSGVSPTDAGEVWHLLDHRFAMEVTLLEGSSIERANLKRYTTIVLPSGNYRGVDSIGKDALKTWMKDGGTLIAVEDAVEWLINTKVVNEEVRKHQGREEKVEKERLPYENAGTDYGARVLSGAILSAECDPTHPLFYGYNSRKLSVFHGSRFFLEHSKNPYSTPLVYTNDPLASGYVHREQLPMLRNAAGVIVNRHGKGRAVLIADNPNFRAFWFGTNKYFLNAIFFGSTIR